MKSFIVFALIIAAAVAAPADPKDDVVVRSEFDNIGVEGYRYGFETSGGISASEVASVKDAGTENEALEVQGQFSYVGNDGITYTVSYTADKFGFKPQGAHLPKA